ncbi:hypothetical protein [Paenibacillus senegalensis]|uniref:hypothetical protein n=1 Tax=Paenibacillus senegalensis TaxID=1465766 RepID=UPI000289F190|nr:hypothetical protein [Paenibacillus senegalensis]
MSRTISVMHMHLKNRWSWIYIPLIIFASSFVVNLAVSIIVRNESIYTGGIISVIIYMFVSGIIVIPQNFPLALGLGTTRTDFFKGTLLTSLIISAVTAVLVSLLGALEQLSDRWGSGLYFFFYEFAGDTALTRFLIYVLSVFLIYLLVFFAGLLIGSVYLRFGAKSLVICGLCGFLGLTVLGYASVEFSWWGPIAEWFVQQTFLSVVLWTIPLTLICMMCSLLLIRRASL